MQMSKILVDIGHRDEHRQMVHYYFLEKKQTLCYIKWTQSKKVFLENKWKINERVYKLQ